MNPLKEVITSNEMRRRRYVLYESGKGAVVSPMNKSSLTKVFAKRF